MHHAGLAVEAGQATHDAQVVRKVAVAVQFLEMGEDVAHIVQRVGPVRVAGNLGDLPGCEVAVDVLGELLALVGQLFDLGRDVNRRLGLHIAQLFDLAFELGDRLFEIEEVLFGQSVTPGSPGLPGGHHTLAARRPAAGVDGKVAGSGKNAQ
jgi:hypothetical protein